MNSKTIARNTAWYGLENLASFITSLVTSIAIARALGPTRMGYIVYVTWVVTVTGSLGSVGIPGTTRKYMAEYLGMGDRATARFIYLRTLSLQAAVATVATLGAILWIWHDAPREYRTAALLLVLSIWPAMVNFISAQANVAAETLSANLPASIASTVTFFSLVLISISMHWGVNGIAASMLSMRLVDFIVRFIPTFRRILPWSADGVSVPVDLPPRMFRFALQSVTGMVLTLIVWDRSEIFLLRHLSTDIRQVAFYSIALGLADRLLIFPSVFAAATGASILAQYGRDRSKLPAMTAASLRYLALASIPVHFVATALSAPALLTMYGSQYKGAILVATCAPLLCLPKAFVGPIQSLFESTDTQKYFLMATVFSSFVDLGVAWALIPAHGALGACIGSGIAQAMAVGMMWGIGIRQYQIRLPWLFLAKICGVSSISAIGAYLAASHLPAWAGLAAGSFVALVLFIALTYVSRMLEPEDISRVAVIATFCPRALATPLNYFFARLSRTTPDSATV